MTHIAPLLSLALLSSLLSWTAAETGVGGHTEVRTHQRVKRGLILNGTRWCGSGNNSRSDEDLGYFAETDSCCHEHDQCNQSIPSFHFQFGVFNHHMYTMSHCDCDNKFHSCLTQANDSMSDWVGNTYFNVLGVHCFELSPPCAEGNGSVMCNETEMAEVLPPTPYITPNRTEVSVISAVNTTVPEGGDDLFLPAENQTLSRPDITEEQLPCAFDQDLDECSYKIRPHQKKYGLYNPEAKTLYHCNCTNRVFQNMAKMLQLTEEQTSLYRLFVVSQSCFRPQDCTAGKMKAVLMRAELLEEDQRSSVNVTEDQSDQ